MCLSYRVLWTVRSPFSGVDGSFYYLPLFCACKALKIKDFSAPNCPHKTSFSVHFLFSAACELWRHSRDSISPGWTLGRTLCRRPHSVSSPYPGKSPLPASRPAARPPSGTTCSRPRTEDLLRAGAGVPVVKGDTVPVLTAAALPADQGWPPVSSAPGSCGRGYRPACAPAAASLYRGYLSCVPSIFRFCRSPRKGFLPHFCGVFRRWHAPHSFGTSCPEVTSGQSVQKLAPCGASPARVFLFGRSFGFQGAAHR